MNQFIRIGPDLINLSSVSRVFRLENQSGISDRLLIEVGAATVIVDSVAGRERMDRIWNMLLTCLEVEDWDPVQSAPLEPEAEAA